MVVGFRDYDSLGLNLILSLSNSLWERERIGKEIRFLFCLVSRSLRY